ncbi:flagellin FliC [Sulfuricella denitrificans skB26]|uniref:Flagellin n=1 Tax=Sulfuricella denitrificans (strain DSM 22764 / NBRC 105220 / skB26) TaxID=1163617 RepID=S6AH71_SULDS|nr:flagellin [Sulfuricella denitrificans]BAN35471.1 flagellin FliC [Sulfuricella denitrificans skB26]
MPQIINTNIASLNAQRNLNTSQAALQTSLQRLSSGLRINSAKDDAAGLAISDRMTSQIRGLNQAARNANDGVSLAQTAEGGLAEVTNNLQRIRELAVQSANSTNTASDRTSLNAEVVQLLAEIQRVATTSQFNGQNILDGTFTASQFQVGANANQTITASTGNSQTTALGSYQVTSNSITAVTGTALTAGQLTLNGQDVGSSTSGSAEAIAASINSVSSKTGVVASAATSVTSTNALLRNQTLQSGDLVINGVSVGAVAGSSNVATQGANVAAAINAVSAQTGVTAAANGGTGALTLSSNTGKTIDITTNAATTADGATRVENATGLELAGATKAFGNSVITVSSGARQVVTNTSTGTAAITDTLTVAGVTFTYSAAANSATNIQIATDSAASTQGANVRAALALNSTVTNAFTITGVTTDAILTAKSNVKSTGFADGLATAAATANASSWASTTVGAGVAIGDTLKVGGLTYEFTAHNASGPATAGNIQVKLGTGGTAATDDDILTATNLASAISAQQAAGNGTVGFTSRTAGALTVTNTLYGGTGVVAAPTEPVTLGTAGAVASVDTAGTSGVYAANSTKGTLSLNSANTFSIGGTSPGAAGLSAASVGLTTIAGVDITTVSGANNAISLIDGALSQVSTIRGSMGALQNRFTSVVASLTASSENLSAARSRIQDADYAAETAQLTRNQILQQAGTAMLAQANQLPNSVLTLLR